MLWAVLITAAVYLYMATVLAMAIYWKTSHEQSGEASDMIGQQALKLIGFSIGISLIVLIKKNLISLYP